MKRIAIFGATSAIAMATARRWATQGHALYLVGRDESKLKLLAQDLTVRGAAEAKITVFDASQIERHGVLLGEIEREFGELDVALIAFGSLGDQKRGEREFAYALEEIRVNFLAPASLSSEIAGRFEARGSGSLLVIGSVAGDRGRASNYIYGSAKGALERFLQGVRARVVGRGVHVALIKPGFVDTPMTASMKKGPLWASPERVGEAIAAALERRADVVYVPWFWWWIMFVIRHIPERIFKRLPL